MSEELFQAMRQSIIDGAPDIARSLAESGVQAGAGGPGGDPGRLRAGHELCGRRVRAAADVSSRHGGGGGSDEGGDGPCWSRN